MESSKSNNSEKIDKDIDITILALGKKCGLSFEEMNQLRVQDLIKFTKKINGKDDVEATEATQNDIDKFYA